VTGDGTSREVKEDEDVKKSRQGVEEPKGISGVLVQNEFKLSLMAPEDLREFAGLTTTTVVCRERLTLRAAGVELIRWALQAAFGEVSEVTKMPDHLATNGNGLNATNALQPAADGEIDRNTTVLEVMSTVRVSIGSAGEVEVEWEGNMLNDGVADAVLGVLLGVERSPAAVARSSKMASHSHSHGHDHDGTNGSANGGAAGKTKKRTIDPKERLSRLFLLLEAQFGADAVMPIEEPALTADVGDSDEDDDMANEKEMQKVLERLHSIGIPVPGVEIKLAEGLSAKVWLEDLRVECANAIWRGRVEAVVREAAEGIAPLWG
jgi:cleavage and polyadenylation specificity factor subunit 3